MRLNKFLAHCGVDSRRNCDEIIFQGRVQVDGETFTNPGVRIDPEHSEILVDGEPVSLKSHYTYIKLHKPRGVITSRKDPHHSQTVMQLLPNVLHVMPVGRLDKDSTGVLLFTDDGDMNYRLTHPGHGVEKEYEVLLHRAPQGPLEEELPKGITLKDKADLVQGSAVALNRNRTHFRVILREGKKREVKRIFRHYNTQVFRLHRNFFAGVTANDLPPGKWKKLNNKEIMQIKKAAGLD
ncbi:MAG: pseudouridine synthase [Fidelibacterota bacterium]